MNSSTPPQKILRLVSFSWIAWLLLWAGVSGCGSLNEVFNPKTAKISSPKSQAKVSKKNSKKVSHHSKKAPETESEKFYPQENSRPVPVAALGYFAWPLHASISSYYGNRHGRFHEGIDIDGEEDDPVMAAASGEVIYSGDLGDYGKIVILKHPNSLFTAYSHNKKNLVNEGDKVQKGQVIGKVGTTGNATGSHLHFEIRDARGTFDPIQVLPK